MTDIINISNLTTNDLVEIILRKSDDFLKIRETLTRLGTTIRQEKVLIQECYILHTKGKYYIAHYKELQALNKQVDELHINDLRKRNTIIKLLEDWRMCSVINGASISYPEPNLRFIKIVPHKEKDTYELISKYNIGQ